jgi:hypothetical protein
MEGWSSWEELPLVLLRVIGQAGPMQNYPEFVRALRDALVWCGTLRVDEEVPAGRVWLDTADGREFSFKESLAGISDAVTAYDSDIMSDPDDGMPITGQLRLFAIHVREAIDTSDDGGHVLVFTGWGVETE